MYTQIYTMPYVRHNSKENHEPWWWAYIAPGGWPVICSAWSASATVTFPLRVFPWNPCLFCVPHSFPRMAVCHVTPTQNWVIMWQSILTQVIRLSLAYPTTASYDSSVNEAITCLPTFCVPNGELQQSLSVSPDQSASPVWDCKRDVILHLRGSHIVCY